MEKPDPQAFAKSVLWHLAGLRADVYLNQLLLVELLAKQNQQPATVIQEQWRAQTEKMRRELYFEALRAAGLEDNPPPDYSQERRY